MSYLYSLGRTRTGTPPLPKDSPTSGGRTYGVTSTVQDPGAGPSITEQKRIRQEFVAKETAKIEATRADIKRRAAISARRIPVGPLEIRATVEAPARRLRPTAPLTMGPRPLMVRTFTPTPGTGLGPVPGGPRPTAPVTEAEAAAAAEAARAALTPAPIPGGGGAAFAMPGRRPAEEGEEEDEFEEAAPQKASVFGAFLPLLIIGGILWLASEKGGSSSGKDEDSWPT